MSVEIGTSEQAVVPFDVEWLLALACQHGEDNDLQSEVGDLQTLVRLGWSLLTVAQRQSVIASEVVAAAVDLEMMATAPSTDDAGADWLTACAREHGEGDDPDHEAGDLQGFLRAMWEVMAIEQHRQMLEDSSVSDIAELGGCQRELVSAADEIDAYDWNLAIEHFGLTDSVQYTDQQVADYMNAFTLQEGVRSEIAHTQHPMKRAA